MRENDLSFAVCHQWDLSVPQFFKPSVCTGPAAKKTHPNCWDVLEQNYTASEYMSWCWIGGYPVL